jgi:hypothetical protein
LQSAHAAIEFLLVTRTGMGRLKKERQHASKRTANRG